MKQVIFYDQDWWEPLYNQHWQPEGVIVPCDIGHRYNEKTIGTNGERLSVRQGGQDNPYWNTGYTVDMRGPLGPDDSSPGPTRATPLA
jgi:hypothetical protein